MPQPEFVMNHVQIFRSGLRWPRWPIGPKRKVPFLMKSQKQDGEAIRWCLFLHTSSVAQVELPPIWIMADMFFLSMANRITNYSTPFSPFVCFFLPKQNSSIKTEQQLDNFLNLKSLISCMKGNLQFRARFEEVDTPHRLFSYQSASIDGNLCLSWLQVFLCVWKKH